MTLTGVATATGSSASMWPTRFGFELLHLRLPASCWRTRGPTPCSSRPGTGRTPGWRGRGSAREGRVRRKAARAERRRAARGARRGARAGSAADGRLQPAVLAAHRVRAGRAAAACARHSAIVYRVNAGPLPRDHWFRDPPKGGGCWAKAVTSSICSSTWRARGRRQVHAVSLDRQAGASLDTFAVTLTFENGAVRPTAVCRQRRSRRSPRSGWSCSPAARSWSIDDFRQAEIGSGGKSRKRRLPRQDKGHAEEIRRFTEAIRTGGPMPIPLEELALSSLVSILAGASIQSGCPERVDLAEVGVLGVGCWVSGLGVGFREVHPNT